MKLDGQQQLNVNIDFERDTTIIKCDTKRVDLEKGIEVDCGGEMYAQGYELRKLSALVSPTGKTSVVPVPVFYCLNCGKEVDMKDIK